MNLFPRLPLSRARTLADELSHMPRSELRERSTSWDDSAIFAPIGGQRVDREAIARIQAIIRLKADAAESEPDTQEAARRRFDFEVARLLYEEMDLSPHEASQLGVWAFLSCIVLPDVVRWRFPGEGDTPTRPERFLGGARGVRNTFGRLWWRAYTLGDPDHVDRWHLVRQLLEDQAVAILERPTIAGYPPLARAVLKRALASGIGDRGISRQDAIRDLSKRLRRLAGVVPLETLSQTVLDEYVDAALLDVERSLAPAGTLVTSPSAPRLGVAEMLSPEESGSLATPPASEPLQPTPRTDTPHVGAAVLEARLSEAVLRDGLHQGAVTVPASLAKHLPALNESYVNPERNVFVVDGDGQRWLWRFVHYNHAGDEYRFAGLSAFLVAHHAKPGDRLRLTVAEDGAVNVELLT